MASPSRDNDPRFTFDCTQCGDCCRGEPGAVWVSQADVGRAARQLGMDRETFSDQYVRVLGRRLSLREFDNGDCVLWDAKVGCTIYPVRPKQCVTFPYWEEILSHDERLKEVAHDCPGIQLKAGLA